MVEGRLRLVDRLGDGQTIGYSYQGSEGKWMPKCHKKTVSSVNRDEE